MSKTTIRFLPTTWAFEGPLDLDGMKAFMCAMGYRFVADADGTERLYRPDGSLAVIASKNAHNRE